MSNGLKEIERLIAKHRPRVESATVPVSLSKLVYDRGLAEVLEAHLDLFDPKTRHYLRGLRWHRSLSAYLLDKINSIKVFEKVSRPTVGEAFREIVGFFDDRIDMIGLGNSIYSCVPIPLDTERCVPQHTAGILGHELIHAIQADARGGEAEFVSAYKETGTYFNEFEVAAYSFGGKVPPELAGKVTVKPPVLQDRSVTGHWWKHP